MLQRAKIPVELADKMTNAQSAEELAGILEKSVRGGQIADIQFGKKSLSGINSSPTLGIIQKKKKIQ